MVLLSKYTSLLFQHLFINNRNGSDLLIHPESNSAGMDICFAEQGPKSAGGRSQGEEKDKQEDRNKEEGKNPTVKNAPGQTPSITDPDTPLTGDTGNMEIGKTDLGAGPVGAGNETKLREE